MTLQESTSRSRRRRVKPVFELLNEHAVCEYKAVPKDRLIIPVDEYQRDESEGRIAAEIAMHFDRVAFGVLLVIQRADGTMMVADGGTRLSAAKQRQDIDTVPCIVFSGLTDKQEADVFLRVNLNRRKLRVNQQHHAELFSDHVLAVKTQQLIDRLSHARVGWDSLDTMRKCVRQNHSAVDTVTQILASVAVDKHVTARVMKGLVRLEIILVKEGRTLNRPPVIRKIYDRFGTFDAVVNVTVEPRRQGDATIFARALARTLQIKFPRNP